MQLPGGRLHNWYVVYRALFFLDMYLSNSIEGFTPPSSFITLDP